MVDVILTAAITVTMAVVCVSWIIHLRRHHETVNLWTGRVRPPSKGSR